jgi:glycosyltransferase involved in cell wall biosynthesis
MSERRLAAPEVSVVLPTRNRSEMLGQALRSALSQEGVDLEVIVIDEGSSDDTPAQLERIDDDRLTVIRHDPPKGVAGARNAAIGRGRGEWVAFLDDDDIWAPAKLRTLLSRAAEGWHSLSYSSGLEVDEGVSVIRVRRAPDPAGLGRRLFASNVIGTPSGVILRADLLERIGGFDEGLSALADWDLWIRAAAAGVAGASREPLVAYRHHAENMMLKDPARITAEFELMRTKHGEEASAAGIEFGAAWLVSWNAARELAAGRRLGAARGYLRRATGTRSPRYLARAIGALGGDAAQRLGRAAVARATPRPDWLDRYA